jgi:hypothetical protein
LIQEFSRAGICKLLWSRFFGIDSASLCSLAGRYDNPIPTLFLAPIDFLKIQAWLAQCKPIFPKTFMGSVEIILSERQYERKAAKKRRMQCEMKVTLEEICMFLCKKRQQQKKQAILFYIEMFFLQKKKKEIYLCPSKNQHKVMFVNTERKSG